MSFLSQFDDSFKPSQGGPGSGLDSLPDTPEGGAPYQMHVTGYNQKEVKGGSMTLFEMLMTVGGGAADGHKIRQQWWIKDQDSVARFGGDLQRMGFDCENWVPAKNRVFSVEFDKAKKCFEGMILLCVKKTTNKTDPATGKVVETYHNLYIQGRGKDGKPEKISEEYLNEVAADPLA